MSTERYHWYVAHGICGRCGQRDVRPGHKLCAECGAKACESYRKWREKGNSNRDYMRNYMPVYRAKRRAQGLCPYCGKNPITDAQTRCNACKARERERVARKRKAAANEHFRKATAEPERQARAGAPGQG